LKEWTTPDYRNTSETTNLEEEEIVDAPENDGNTSMPEQVKQPKPRKMMMMMIRNTKPVTQTNPINTPTHCEILFTGKANNNNKYDSNNLG
jgi:hypothetical protein